MQFNAKKFIKMINTQQWDKVENFFHKNIEYTNPFCPEKVKGLDKAKLVISEQDNILPDYKYELKNVMEDENNVCLRVDRTGSRILWKGTKYIIGYTMSEVIWLELKDDKIISFRGYFDAADIMRSLENAIPERKDTN